MIFGTKWAVLLLGPILALGWGVVVALVIYQYVQDPTRPAPFTNFALAVITILLAAIGLLLTAVIGSALAGASMMGFAGFVTYREPSREEAPALPPR